ncbi:MAG: hypothetical protein F4244_08425, partial [Gammaproteobacteria bacterium]|nr:hypothetical protein [Gammaproteobacteria bacterium]
MTEVRVPDIGDFKDVEIIELLVGPGDRVEPEAPLLTLESDKATMEIPSPSGGVIGKLHVGVGDRVSEGSLILELEGDSAPDAETPATEGEQQAPAPSPEPETPPEPAVPPAT